MKETSTLLKDRNNANYMSSTAVKNKLLLRNNNEFRTYHILHYIYASIIFAVGSFFIQSIAPITDVLQKELNITSSGIGLLSASFFITFCILQLPVGVLLQNYSHHILLLTMAIGVTITWILFSFSSSFIFALIIRILAGLFSCPSWIIIANLAGDHFGNNQVALLLGFAVLLQCILVLIGVTVQGYVYEKYHIWRETYYFIGFIGVIMVIAIMFTMYCQKYDIKQRRKKIMNVADASWIHIFSASTASLMDPFKREQHHNCTKLKIVITNYLNWCLAIWGFAAYTIYSSIFGLWLIPYLMTKFSYSRTLSSFYAGIGVLATGFGAILFGFLQKKYKKRKIFLMMQLLLVSTFLFLLYLDEDMLNEYIVFIIIVLCGIGDTTVSIFSLVREYNAKYETEEIATGFVTAISTLSGLLASYIIGLLIDYHSNITEYTGNNYQFALSCVITTCLIILVFTTLLLKETNGKNMT